MNERRRGRNKCKEIARLKPNEKLQVTFYGNRVVGEHYKLFARHLGIIVRDTNICPLRVHKWNDIGDIEKEHMWSAVRVILHDTWYLALLELEKAYFHILLFHIL